MPVVFRQDGYRFLFYSDEGEPREPVHVHVRRGRDNAKFSLWPNVRLDYDRGCTSAEQRRITLIVEQRRDEIERAWNVFFA